MEKFKVRDLRNKQFFMVDDAYLNGYAKLCGYKATLVYLALCRHASKDQECFPSIKKISEKLGISKDSVKRGIRELKKTNIIDVKQGKKGSGLWKNNTYLLLDKSVWETDGGAVQPHGDGGAGIAIRGGCGSPDGGAVEAHKETHREGNTYKETHINLQNEILRDIDSVDSKQIVEAITAFNGINPNIKYGSKTQRAAASRLVKKIGLEKYKKAVEYAAKIQVDKYAPVITTPVQLEDKFAQLLIYYKKNQNDKLFNCIKI